MKKQYTNKERKLWKLKRKNVVLGQQRAALFYRMLCYVANYNLPHYRHVSLNKQMCNLSEQIGKNSAKIQRLRTQIQQEKKLNEHSNCT